ncbi:stress protein [Bacillus amyloliquefaciens]|uniref:stress protein n=1 Tax=Bacillus amyloliquefaciens TaxID=1390 RepID=UPI002670A5A1|nr:stress protein [Bacillus amyloliquefaciens]WKT35455.1 stress protein [Bacillus amyloliquefaciens]
MKRMRIPMSVALGAALSLTPLSFVSAKENLAPQNMAQQTSDVSAKDVGLNIDVDLLGIGNSIADAIKSAQNRDGFVKNLMESSFYASGQKYNVMVFNLSQEYEDHFNGVQFYGSAVYDGITYGIWVFEDGSFTNKGDGGWINWAFRGWFDRDGDHVEFHRP